MQSILLILCMQLYSVDDRNYINYPKHFKVKKLLSWQAFWINGEKNKLVKYNEITEKFEALEQKKCQVNE